MKIQSSDLINLPVYTQSGQHLGRVDSFEVDIDSHTITHYHIKTGLIKELWHEQLVIASSQVVSISKKKMVVEDNVKKEPASEMGKATLATPVAK